MLRTTNRTRPRGADELLGPALASRLTQLDLASRRVFAGKLRGERRSKKRGQSVEFADHRQYVSGDDLRHIDWNIFGRLDRLFLKLFLEEEDLSLHVVIDASLSMDCGEPSKYLLAQKLGMAIGYVGLVNLNRVSVSAIGGTDNTAKERTADAGPDATPEPATPGTVLSTLNDLRGRRRAHDLGRFIAARRPDGAARFTEACKRIALTRRGKGVMVIVSDFFMKEGYEEGLRLMVGRGYDLFAVQVLSPQELEPTLGGDLRLKDVEDGDTADVTISAPLLKRYKANLAAYTNQLRSFCERREISLVTVPSDLPVDSLVLDVLRKRGLLR